MGAVVSVALVGVITLTVWVTGSPELGRGKDVMFEIDSDVSTKSLFQAGGWTALTAVNLVGLGFVVTFVVATAGRLF